MELQSISVIKITAYLYNYFRKRKSKRSNLIRQTSSTTLHSQNRFDELPSSAFFILSENVLPVQ